MVNVLRDDPSIGEMVDSWFNGNTGEVLDNLWQYPPHVTAFSCGKCKSDITVRMILI